MIEIKNLTVKLGNQREIIKDLSFVVKPGDKLAIIGEEGNGKSTLLKAVLFPEYVSSYASVTGSVNIKGEKIGFLEQILDSEWFDLPVYSYFLRDKPKDEDDYSRFNNFNIISAYFSNLKLDASLLESSQTIGTLSGGEKIKMQLAKILASEPTALFLDEPTNDIDISTLSWLENFIINYKNPIVFISHDETLLEKAANCVLHLEQIKKKSVFKYTYESIGFKEYVEKREASLARQGRIATKEREEDRKKMEKWRDIYNRVNHELNTISRKDPHGARLLKKKMKSVKSQEARFERERTEFTDIPDPEEAIKLRFNRISIPNSKVVLDYKVDALKIGDKKLSEKINLKVIGPEKIAIIGRNGVGKTTLLKNILQKMKRENSLTVGYMPQDYNEEFNKYDNVGEFIETFCNNKEDYTRARTYLGSLKFTKEEVALKIDELSGGQKAKLYLLKLMMEENNVLILDEPTRNLSPLSNPVVREAFKKYEGAIISVSHDRKFLQEVADKVYVLENDGLHVLQNKVNQKSNENTI